MNKQQLKETKSPKPSYGSKLILNSVKTKKTSEKKLEIDVDDILFSQDSISSKFKDGTPIEETISNIKLEKIKISNFPSITVIKIGDDSDPDYVSIDNRRLYIFQQALKWKRNKKIKVIVVNAKDVMKITKSGKVVTYQDDLDRKNTSKNNGETIKVRDGSPWYKIRKGRNGGEYIYDPTTYKRVYVSQLSKTSKEKILKKIEADKLESKESENLKQTENTKENVKKNEKEVKGSEKLKGNSKINQNIVVEKRDFFKKEPKNQVSKTKLPPQSKTKTQTLPPQSKNQNKIQPKNIVNSEKKDYKKNPVTKEKTVKTSRKELKPTQQSKNKPISQNQSKKLSTVFEKTQKNDSKQTKFPIFKSKSYLNDEPTFRAHSDFLDIESNDESLG
jgi:hypothetical protein